MHRNINWNKICFECKELLNYFCFMQSMNTIKEKTLLQWLWYLIQNFRTLLHCAMSEAAVCAATSAATDRGVEFFNFCGLMLHGGFGGTRSFLGSQYLNVS